MRNHNNSFHLYLKISSVHFIVHKVGYLLSKYWQVLRRNSCLDLDKRTPSVRYCMMTFTILKMVIWPKQTTKTQIWEELFMEKPLEIYNVYFSHPNAVLLLPSLLLTLKNSQPLFMNNYGKSKNLYSAGLVAGNISYNSDTLSNASPKKFRDSQFTISENSSSVSFRGLFIFWKLSFQ